MTCDVEVVKYKEAASIVVRTTDKAGFTKVIRKMKSGKAKYSKVMPTRFINAKYTTRTKIFIRMV